MIKNDNFGEQIDFRRLGLYKSVVFSNGVSLYHKYEGEKMGKNWTTFEVLRQSRHDWLNKITNY